MGVIFFMFMSGRGRNVLGVRWGLLKERRLVIGGHIIVGYVRIRIFLLISYKFVSNMLAGVSKPPQTITIILPNLIHKSKVRNLKP